MKFLVTSGRGKGLAFEVEDQEVKIGRRKDNDIVLDDESISSCHAKLYAEDDQVFVEDCNSINGVEVNGKTIKKAILKPGNILTIGATKITVVDEEEEKAPAPPSQKKTGSSAARRSSPVKMIFAAILVLAVIGTAYFLPELRKKIRSANRSGASTTTGYAEKAFRLSYEKVQASKENIFRYEMKIEGDTLSAAIDDLKQGRHLQKNKKIDSSSLEGVQKTINDHKFFSLPPLTEGKSKDFSDSYTLGVVLGGKAHRAQFLNRVLPEEFKRICSTIENFGETELGIAAISMPTEELRKRAQDTYQRARELYNKRTVDVENLFNSIKAYSEVILYLETVEPKPSIYGDAIHDKQLAIEELDKQIKNHEFNATRFTSNNDWKRAREELILILKKLPDTTDERYQNAKIKLLDVERRIQPK